MNHVIEKIRDENALARMEEVFRMGHTLDF